MKPRLIRGFLFVSSGALMCFINVVSWYGLGLLAGPALFGIIAGVFSTMDRWNSTAHGSKKSVIIYGVGMGAMIAPAFLVLILILIFLGVYVFGSYEWCQQ